MVDVDESERTGEVEREGEGVEDGTRLANRRAAMQAGAPASSASSSESELRSTRRRRERQPWWYPERGTKPSSDGGCAA